MVEKRRPRPKAEVREGGAERRVAATSYGEEPETGRSAELLVAGTASKIGGVKEVLGEADVVSGDERVVFSCPGDDIRSSTELILKGDLDVRHVFVPGSIRGMRFGIGSSGSGGSGSSCGVGGGGDRSSKNSLGSLLIAAESSSALTLTLPLAAGGFDVKGVLAVMA